MNIYLIDMGYVNRSYTEAVEVGIGVMIVAGILKNDGHNVMYCENLIHHLDDIEVIVQSIEKFGAEAVVFSTRCDNYILALKTVLKIKKRNKNIVTVFAGPQATHTDIETIKNFKDIDVIIRNEGEKTTRELFRALEHKKNLNSVDGITYRIGENYIRNKDRELLSEIKYIPDYSIMPAEYIENLKKFMNAFRIEAGRGCPYRCTFCSTNRMWKRRYRLKTVKQIYSEMILLNKMYGVKHFVLEHDSLSANRKFFRTFLTEMINVNKQEFSWKCSSRVDTLYPEDVEVLWKAGCREIYFGIESGSEKMQREYKKCLNLDRFPELIYALNKRGIYYTCSFICGHPVEKKEDFEKTLNLMLFCNIFFNCKEIQLHRLSPENGSELYDTRKTELILDKNQVSDQAVSISFNYEYDLIKKYPSIFASYYSFELEQEMKKIYDSALTTGIKLIRLFPISIYIIKKILDISMLDVILWRNEDEIHKFIDSLETKTTSGFYEKIKEIYEFEVMMSKDEYSQSVYPSQRYLQIDLKDIIGIDICQSIYIKRDKEGRITTYLNCVADLMHKYSELRLNKYMSDR